MPSRRLAAAAAALALVLSGCGDGDGGPTAPTATAAGASLAFTSAAVGGGTVDSAEFKGRPALLWFWAPW